MWHICCLPGLTELRLMAAGSVPENHIKFASCIRFPRLKKQCSELLQLCI